ncbi:RNA-directed DNA polymerase, eukaryota [Tanacetum coccineum]|uniref:RNA-directed DNA polymerase, eukaryota n=1 Tax=Tanacetum coccineum TaxID=301880 RepID=A0ABQ4ZGW3_9ASTR
MYLGGYWYINSRSLSSKEKLIKHTGVLSWFSELGHANNLFVSDVRLVWTAIEGLPICAWNKDAIAKIVSPWGTLSDDDTNNGNSLNTRVSRVHSGVNQSFSLKSRGSIMDVIENLVDIGQTTGPSAGFSGGILCVWDPNIFVKDNATISDSFVAVRDLSEKKSLWEYITHIIDLWDGECIILGLIDLPLKGYSYTWSIKSASKMSKLDRFLVSEGLLMLFPSLSALCLERHLSDHRPIIMREVVVDYGPSPFRVYHSWFTKDGFDKLVEDSWKTSSFADSSKITILRKKFQALKASIKAWCKDDKHRSSEYRLSIQSRISDLDKMFDSGHSNEELVNERTSLLKVLHNINKYHSLDMAQKAKVRWSIEGDKNSKFFHGIINMKRSQLAIHGVLIEGDWIDKPYKVKNKFLNHFSNRFARPTGPNIVLDSNMFKQLSSEQIADLECDVTYDEIKRAVWDCGTNKSPGPDGFTFDFIRTYWKIINQDVVNAVREFFVTSKFPPGSNSSFIALIPKKQDAKLVKDFRPISLIGCFYKIIAKILANRLSMVILDLISDVQSAFVPNRQILYGPFILNKLISWCKFHKSKAMIFKVDFEKAFDSVRWDYLDGILSNFGFGSKWREWIQGCLSSAMGSILVNGSPTSEFKFHKGLKQGDPLSPFLFILVMESLHLSFNNILNAGLFKGIRIDDSLTLSYLFYADDAIFIEEVKAAASIIGCSTFSNPFTYLGVKVGMSSSRRKSWDEVIGKISACLSKWKIKTLSIGGRLTLIKSVLTSLPLYHMPIYKAPMGVLRDMESFRKRFFNGIDKNERKISMIGWNKILASKKKVLSCDRLLGIALLESSVLCPPKRKVARWWDFDIPEFSSYSYEEWITWFKSIRIPKAVKDVLEGVCYVVGDLEISQRGAFWKFSASFGSSL